MVNKNLSKKKKIIITIIAILFILFGIFLLLYPKMSNYSYQKQVKESKKVFEEKIVTEEDSFELLYKELQKRNQQLYKEKQSNLKDPFSYEQPTVNLREYGIEDDVIGYLYIPKLNVELPILLGANAENMLKGAVHLTETSYPIGGTNTNTVIAAHRGYSQAELFRNIDKLEFGDKLYIQNFREELVYEVVEIKIIAPTDINELLIQEGRDLISLITCHPYRINSHRYVVYCERTNI